MTELELIAGNLVPVDGHALAFRARLHRHPKAPDGSDANSLGVLERFELCFAPGTVVRRVLEEAFPRKNVFLERLHESDHASTFDLGMSFESGQKTLLDEDALEAEISRSSLINLVEAILVEAVDGP